MRRTLAGCVLVVALSACGRDAAPAVAPAAAKPTPASPSPQRPVLKASAASLPPSRVAEVPPLESLVHLDDTFDTLRARYGDAIARETLSGGEGEEFPGWVLFPKDATRRIEVFLDDAGVHPSSLVVRDASTWVRADGVKVGMRSGELEALNGRPFVFSGFDWDYGGTVTDWKGGRLDHGGRFVGRVMLCAPEHVPEDYPSGDADFTSDLPVLKSHPANVCDFSVELAPTDAS